MTDRRAADIKIILAMLIWGSLALFVRAVDFSSAEIVLARIIFALLFLLALRRIQPAPVDRAALRQNTIRLLLTGAAMGFNWVCLFEAYRWVDVGVATLCYYFAPVLVMLGAVFFYHERLKGRQLAALALALIGVALVSGIAPGGAMPLRGIVLGLASALLYAGVTLSNKAIKGLGGLDITLMQLLGALMVILPYALITHSGAWRAPRLEEWLCMAALGILHTGAALYLYFSAIRDLPVQRTALLSYIDPLSALGFAALFLGERLTPLRLLGAVLILGGALLGAHGGESTNQRGEII